jgi:hypothetical protein
MNYSETIGQGLLRVTPLRVAVTAASIRAGRPVTPTIQVATADITAGRDLAVATPLTPVTTFAQIGQGQYAGWHIEAGPRTVLVIAMEQHDESPARLRQVADAVSHSLSQ